MLLPPARIFRRCLPYFALLAWAIVVRGAESAASPLATNPRYTGSPVVRTWLAEDYGASPLSFQLLEHPRTGFIYVANETGVLEFDGVRWRLIPMPRGKLVSSVGIDWLGRVWGCGGSEIGGVWATLRYGIARVQLAPAGLRMGSATQARETAATR